MNTTTKPITMPNHRVLYLSYDGMTDPLGQSQVIPYLQGLAAKGYEISLISFEKSERESGKPQIADLLQKAGIAWHPLSYTKKPPVLSTLWDVYRMKKTALALHKENPFQIVHCRSYISALVGAQLKKEKGMSFVFDMRGFWADERADGKIWDLSKPLYKTVYRFFKRKEQDFISEADYVVSLTRNAKQEIETWPGWRRAKTPIEVIPCCADMSLFDPASVTESAKADLKSRLGLEDKGFTLLYLGAVGTWYMLPEMMAFFKELLKTKPEAKFLFVTAEEPEYILAEARRNGLDENALIIRKAARHEVPLYISVCDLSIFFILPAYSKKASSPTKQGEIMAMGLPVICNAGVGDTDYVLRQYSAGLLIESFDEKAYAEAASRLGEILKLDKKALQEGAKDYFGLKKGVDSYLKVYAACLEKNKHG